jgi:hypothetical protein
MEDLSESSIYAHTHTMLGKVLLWGFKCEVGRVGGVFMV